jgi:hypothetical protein
LLAQGDANRDRAVDGADLLAWQRNVGAVAAAAVETAVKEPGFGILLGAAAACCMVSLRRAKL